MPTIRVMAVFQGGSGLPEDRFINVFHFHDPTNLPYDGAAEVCRQRVSDFYLYAGANDPLGLYLSPYIDRTFQINSYNMLLDAGEREPTTETFELPTGGDEGLPEEVAIVLTLNGAPPITKRRRGRIYIGPLANQSTTVDWADTATPCRVELSGASNIGSCILDKASVLADNAAATPWCIRSQVPTENYVPIVSGYVDDAFDTQRRRGPDPTTRNFFVQL